MNLIEIFFEDIWEIWKLIRSVNTYEKYIKIQKKM